MAGPDVVRQTSTAASAASLLGATCPGGSRLQAWAGGAAAPGCNCSVQETLSLRRAAEPMARAARTLAPPARAAASGGCAGWQHCTGRENHSGRKHCCGWLETLLRAAKGAAASGRSGPPRCEAGDIAQGREEPLRWAAGDVVSCSISLQLRRAAGDSAASGQRHCCGAAWWPERTAAP